MMRRVVITASNREPLTNKEAMLARNLYDKYREILNLLDGAPDKLMNSSTIFEDILDEAMYLENL